VLVSQWWWMKFARISPLSKLQWTAAVTITVLW